jgi:hypothetical protein
MNPFAPVNYFAYGSNMSMPRIRARVPSARPLGVFALPGHELRFHKIGRDGSAKCDAFFTGRETDAVHGVVFEIAAGEIDALDRAEDLGRGYRRRTVTVFDPTEGRIEAFAYFAIAVDQRLRPFTWYKQHVLAGARSAGLRPRYVHRIEGVESIRDPDSGRELREMAIHGVGTGRLA